MNIITYCICYYLKILIVVCIGYYTMFRVGMKLCVRGQRFFSNTSVCCNLGISSCPEPVLKSAPHSHQTPIVTCYDPSDDVKSKSSSTFLMMCVVKVDDLRKYPDFVKYYLRKYPVNIPANFVTPILNSNPFDCFCVPINDK